MTTTNKKTRPFLKWAGNKFRIIERIQAQLPAGKRLIEPFLGSAAVFLNTDFKENLLSDSNPDLIGLYHSVQQHGTDFIEYTKRYFTKENNNAERYYELRETFNQCTDVIEKSALFIYLNRHGYNGLCRYNRDGQYNVPFGRFERLYFPEEALQAFHNKAQQAEFQHGDFSDIMQQAEEGDVVYCDPPYVPLSETASFTNYSKQGFGVEQQQKLANLAKTLADKGVIVLLSNHATLETRQLYEEAAISEFSVARTISCNKNKRQPAKELLALYANELI